jgi:PAS domain S-box-containing protein
MSEDPRDLEIAALRQQLADARRERDEQAARLRASVAEAEDRLSAVLTAARAGVWHYDLVGRTVRWSEQCHKLYGTDPQSFQPTYESWLELVHPSDRPAVRREVERAFQRRRDFDVEFRVPHPALGQIWLWEIGHIEFDGNGRPVRMAGITLDVTERKHNEEVLRRSERLYRGIGESINYGIWVCDANGRNVYASQSFLDLVGITQEQCSSFGWGDRLHPDDAAGTLEAWKATVASGTKWEREHRFLGRDGRWHSVLARGVPIRDDEERIVCWAGINLDISRLKEVEAALKESDRRKDEFLAVLAHELRNPLAPLVMALQLVKDARDKPELMEQLHRTMDRQVRQMARLIEDLLDVSRISRGKIELRREPVLLADVVNAAVETSQPLIQAGGHQLEVVMPPEPLIVWVDHLRMAQVLANLLNNSAKYTEGPGRITLAAEAAGGVLRVSVRDSGVGIPPEMLARVFDLFAQADRSLDRARGGLGIGLTLARSLVELHGGTVEAHSEGPGRGSEFVITVPLNPVPTAVEGQGEERAAGSGQPISRRVLVADDNADAAATLALALESLGHVVQTASDGLEALDIARRFQPSVMFLDLGMPGLTGFDVARHIRSGEWNEMPTLVAVTGWGQDDDRRRSREAGFDVHLVKPVDRPTLERLLAALEHRNRTRRPWPRSSA